ncbi:hypothetical protein AAG906_020065 [Vitis piasezkii]
MAEQIPFSIMEHILMKLGSSAGQAIGLAFGLRKELAKLQETLSTIRDVLLDAEEQQGKSHAVQNWVRKLKEVIYDADDLLDDFAAHDLRPRGIASQVGDFFSSSNQVEFRFKMGYRIEDIKGRLDDVANGISKFNFIPRVTTNMRVENSGRETHSFVLPSEIMGRDEDKKKIIQLLLQSNNEENLSVVAIVGIGGLGKTTLAQFVYNDEEVVKHFDLRLWTCVSDDFDVKIIVKNIIKSATTENVGNLGILLKVGAKGSKVVVTTRSSIVASIMGIDSPYVLKGLTEDQSWALFENLAFGEEQHEADPNLLKIGKEIIKMCNGVPLAIRTLGRILHSRTEESQWLSIKNNKNLMLLRDGNNILLVLKLSYDNLPSHLKQCFTYCALFPKDYKIEKKLLIQLWMAQGYIQPSDGNEHLEDVGDQYFEELLSRSLFQEIEKDNNNNILSCKMHDLIHDMAQFVAKSEIFIVTDDVKNISERIYHMSIFKWSPTMMVLKANSIRTLFGFSENNFQYGDNITVDTLISNCECLRVLDLSWLIPKKLPKSLVKLVHLRYLDLSYGKFEVLPSGITSLKHLQTLKLFACQSLKELPKDIRKMINLRHLEIDGCIGLNYMPCRLGELTMLQTLPLFIIGKGDRKGVGRLNELKCLNNLRGGLRIINLERGALESKEANLKEKHYLQSLRLEWDMWEASSSNEDGVLVMEGLQPHPNLKVLRIEGYPGVRFPSWLSSMLPSLQVLDLRDLNALEYMLENSSSAEPFFPSLKTLNLARLRNFKGWCRREIAGEQGPSFPSLSQLEICNCHQLTTFQLLSSPLLSLLQVEYCRGLTSFQLPSSPRLSKLVIKDCSSLESLQLSSCPSLSELEINGCDELTTFQLLSSPLLSILEVRGCGRLTSFKPLSSHRLSKLVIENCRSLKSPELPSVASLSELQINGLESLQLPSCPSLSELYIGDCGRLATFKLISSPHLSRLQICHCNCLESLQLPSLPCLEKLNLGTVCEEKLWQIILFSSSLESLHIVRIHDLVSLPDDRLQHLTSLKSLKIEDCEGLMSLFQGIQHLSALEELRIINCMQLNLSDKEDGDGDLQFQGLRSLRELFIQNIPKLVSLPKGLQHVTTLETLSIEWCSDFTTLPDWIGSLTSLSKLKIWWCPRFKLEDRSKIAHIREFDIH